MPVRPYPAASSRVYQAGVPQVAVYAGATGGMITNPSNSGDQGLAVVENLYYDLTGPAAASETGTTFPLQPGQTLKLPPNLTRDVSVNSGSSGHRFSAVIWQTEVYPPVPVPGTFPPAGPTSLLKTIPSYLYEQYQDDDDLQAWVRAYNEVMQEYIDWFNQVGLPVYTGTLISGRLLDLVAEGLYGMRRPVLSSGRSRDLGPYNTSQYDQVPYNSRKRLGPSDVTVTTDDIFKRIMTWNLYRGDGKVWGLTWLKRRVARFLFGPNGTDPVIEDTYGISAFYAARTQVDLILPPAPLALVLKEAIESGAVELPFQLSFSVTIST